MTTVTVYQLSELARGSDKNRIIVDTSLNTGVDVRKEVDKTIIRFPYGNKFDIVNGEIIVHDKL